MDERIIQYVKEYLEKVFTKHAYNITDLDKVASELKKDSDELSRNILQILIENLNISFREDKSSRKEKGLVMKEKERSRCILTELGEIHFNRDYYYNKNTGSYETPIDVMLGIEPRERIGAEICSRLVSKATEESYARSSRDVTGGVVSRQTVRNQIIRAPILEKQPEEKEKKRCRVLEIYADEDHAHLQKPDKEKGKRSKMVPLVTISEGLEQICSNRRATINPVHFVDENMDTKDLWLTVEGYIEKAYDIGSLEEIRLHGDGGYWIQNGLKDFDNVLNVLDKWHLQDRLRSLGRRFPKQNLRKRINDALTENNRNEAEAILSGLFKLCRDKRDFDHIQETQTFLFSKWEAAVNAMREDMSGSCTEAQISHILSERFSRNPMGWSVECLGKLSKLRVYIKNGEEIRAEHFKTSYEGTERYKEYAERILEEQIGKYDLSWMSDLREHYVFDTTSGTQQAIKKLGRLHNNLVS